MIILKKKKKPAANGRYMIYLHYQLPPYSLRRYAEVHFISL